MVIPYMPMLVSPQNWTGYVLKVLSLYSLFIPASIDFPYSFRYIDYLG